MNRLSGLELLRGVAALLVLLEHLPGVTWVLCGQPAAMPRLLMGCVGYWGVDVFFVLSGYLIGLTLDKPTTTAKSFLLTRLARVLPLYYAVSVLCVAAPALRFFDDSAAMVVTTFTLTPMTGDAGEPVTAHPYGWTLCYEILFYLAATVLAAAVGGRRAVPALIGLFTLAPLALTALGPVAGWAYPNFALCPVTAEFALGLIAYRLTARLPRRAAWALLAVGVIGLVRGSLAEGHYAILSVLIADPSRAWTRVARFGLPAALCVWGVARLDSAGTFEFCGRFATWCGGVSYSLYLVQPIAFALCGGVTIAWGLTSPWPVAAGTLVATLALAALVARYVDAPLHALAKGWARRATSTPPAGSPRMAAPPLALIGVTL